MFREKLEKIITKAQSLGLSAQEISFLITLYTDEELDIIGNGWVDGDEIFENLKEDKYQEYLDILNDI